MDEEGRPMLETEKLSLSRWSEEQHCPCCRKAGSQSDVRASIIFAILSMAIFSLAGFVWLRSSSKCDKLADTDLAAASPAVRYETVKFTGPLQFDDSGDVYRVVEPGSTQYVGEPSPAIDQAWTELLQAQIIFLSGNEAGSVAQRTLEIAPDLYETGLDYLHQLHCVNKIRQSLRPDYYPDPDGERVRSIHNDHCIDYIRQSIMCQADLTPIETYFSPWLGRATPNFATTHTCRNYESLQNWTKGKLAAAKEKYDLNVSLHEHA